MNPETIYDILGIGIGPFNLGLAALGSEIPGLNCIFFDTSSEFDWHPGMMLPSARLQVPFYADLVTVVSPRSKFTYTNFLFEKQIFIRFGNHDNNFTTRIEYNAYCKWVASQLPSLYFNSQVTSVEYSKSENIYYVTVLSLTTNQSQIFFARHIVIGIGTEPALPNIAQGIQHPYVVHSSQYLSKKSDLLMRPAISVIGSGQSAAEIFHDLLQENGLKSISWFTRSERFYPMEYSKLTLEMTSPDYIDFFYSLKPEKKSELLKQHDNVYKGINFSLINEIYDLIYLKQFDKSAPNILLQANTELKYVKVEDAEIETVLYHKQLEQQFSYTTSALILATGYKPRKPAFLKYIADRINWLDEIRFNVNRNYSIDKSGKQIFVQNAELHTHGFSAPDLGLGPYRNATILNAILGYERFKLEKKTAFQNFGFNNSKSVE